MLYRVLAALAAIALAVLGFFFLTIALLIGAAVALVIGVRLWWTLRKLKKMHAGGASMPSGASARGNGDQVIDGDFQVVERENSNPRLPREPRQ